MTSSTSERNEAIRLIQGLESGQLAAHDAFQIAEAIDPVLVHFTIRYLRDNYPPSHQDGAGIAARLVELTTAHPHLVKKAKEGEADPITEWFDDTYNVRDYRDQVEEMVDLLYAKIDG